MALRGTSFFINERRKDRDDSGANLSKVREWLSWADQGNCKVNKVIKTVAWTRVEGHYNMILANDKIRISYNPVAGDTNGDPIGELVQEIGSLFYGEGEPQEETAFYDGEIWRILLGDYRKQYEVAFPDYDKCLAVYNKYKDEHRSGWSTD